MRYLPPTSEDNQFEEKYRRVAARYFQAKAAYEAAQNDATHLGSVRQTQYEAVSSSTTALLAFTRSPLNRNAGLS